jgi:hypothetical protein
VLLTAFDCTEFFPGLFAASSGIAIQLDKAGGIGSGSVVVTEDTVAPFDCQPGAGTTTTTGPLTLTPLPLNHDQDADGCTDWDELDAVTPGDPFNPYDFDGDLPPFGNGSAGIDNGPGLIGDNKTVPKSDTVADGCDADRDNDGLPDAGELSPTGCGTFDLSTTAHPNPARGDFTDDDDGDGVRAQYHPDVSGDPDDDGPSWDTDNDSVLDGVECALGTNPRSVASTPTAAQCGGTADLDLDGLTARAERCKWGTVDGVVDSDGDGRADCVEANDIDGNGVQNFPGDTTKFAQASFNQIGQTMVFDLNGDAFINFPGDATLSAKMAFHTDGICLG